MSLAYAHLYNDKLRGATCGKEDLHEFNLTRKSNKVTCSDCLRHFAAQLEADCEKYRAALEDIKYGIASCQAGDGDDRTWKEAALHALEDIYKALASNAGEGKEECFLKPSSGR